ncbi:hypothetical protein B0T10DRAFT_460125 [Thelonectria olida]|uniref:Uncharacterized protein n=1 Tax=Thelonectria olida TaxID=1576542 RepID=A0A9P9APB4_9HYPO|nr:hypothetical protein B0T10DRAFT_460125 [Thelonectria olida]
MSSSTATQYRQFQVDRHIISRPNRYDIAEIGGDTAFYINVNVIKRKKPSLVLHAGPSIEAPIAAVCHFIKLGGHFKVGFGDPEKVDSVEWDDMTRQNVTATEYRWETALANGQGETQGERRTLTWKRTQSVSAEGLTVSAMPGRNYKLVDEKTGEILAVFTSKRTIRNCGTLEVRVNLGPAFDQLAVITCISLYEKSRRDS